MGFYWLVNVMQQLHVNIVGNTTHAIPIIFTPPPPGTHEGIRSLGQGMEGWEEQRRGCYIDPCISIPGCLDGGWQGYNRGNYSKCPPLSPPPPG